MEEIASKERTQAPPTWVVWKALTDLTPDAAPPAEVSLHLRHRLNYLINGKLRGIFGE